MKLNNISRLGRFVATAVLLSSAGCKINLPELQHRSHPRQQMESLPLEAIQANIRAKGINNTQISEFQIEDSDFEPDRPGAMPYQYLFPLSEISKSGIKLQVFVPDSVSPESMVWIGNLRVSCDDERTSDLSVLKPNIHIINPDGKPIKAKTAINKGILQVVLKDFEKFDSNITFSLEFPKVIEGAGCVVHAGFGIYQNQE